MKIDLSMLRRASTRGLASAIVLVILAAATPAYLTFRHVQDRQILADRGARVEVGIRAVDPVRRSTDAVHVRPLNPPYFEATLDSAPGRNSVGDQFELVFDPLDPGRVAAVGQPLIDSGNFAMVLIDLLTLLALLALLLPIAELARRAWTWIRGESPSTMTPPNMEGRTPRTRRRLLSGWASTQIAYFLILAPVLSALITGLIVADFAKRAEALETSGVSTEAVIDKSIWGASDGGSLDVRFTLRDGAEASAHLSAQGDLYYEGDNVEIVYEAASPRNARLADSRNEAPWVYVTVFIALATTAAVTVPVAIWTLLRRAWSSR